MGLGMSGQRFKAAFHPGHSGFVPMNTIYTELHAFPLASVDSASHTAAALPLNVCRQRKQRLVTTAEEQEKRKAYLAKVVHELRTPLTCINGVIALLEQQVLGELNDEGRRMVPQLKQTCTRMARLVDEIMDLEKLRSGKLALNRRTVDVKANINQVVATIQPIAESRSIIVKTKKLNVFADADRVAQVLMNFIANAIKNSPDNSTIEVKAELLGEYVKISVRDQGTGIAADMLPRIFDLYEQVDSLTSNHGWGVGLALCKELIAAHDGQIGVTSKPGTGSCFWFTIPIAK